MKRGPFLHGRTTTRMMMVHVVAALGPALIAVVWRHGWHGFAILSVCSLVACLSDALCSGRRVLDGSALVIGLILALMLPATAPLWLGALATAAAVFFGKHGFGGLGKNTINPAAAARAAFMVIAPGYFLAPNWTIDGISGATPLATESDSIPFSVIDVLLGHYPGAIGEAMPLAILAGGLSLLAVRTIDWRAPLVYLAVIALLALVLPPGARMEGHAPWLAGNPLIQLLGGGTLIAAFFMITDPVTSPLTRGGRMIAAAIAAVYCILIRYYTPYPDAAALSVLAANAATPLIDHWIAESGAGCASQIKVRSMLTRRCSARNDGGIRPREAARPVEKTDLMGVAAAGFEPATLYNPDHGFSAAESPSQ